MYLKKCMADPQAADGGRSLQIIHKVAVNIMNKQSQTANKRGSP
jgi:hypothetical protein